MHARRYLYFLFPRGLFLNSLSFYLHPTRVVSSTLPPASLSVSPSDRSLAFPLYPEFQTYHLSNLYWTSPLECSMGAPDLYVPPRTCSISYAVQYQALSPPGEHLEAMLGPTPRRLIPSPPPSNPSPGLSSHFRWGDFPSGHWHLLLHFLPLFSRLLNSSLPLLPSNSLKTSITPLL